MFSAACNVECETGFQLKEDKMFIKSTIGIFRTALILGIIFIIFSAYLAYQHMGKLHEQRLEHLKQTVQIARNSIEPILISYRNKSITNENALNDIRNLIRRMKYNDHIGENYIFMSSYKGIMLVQPYEPDKEMTSAWELQDYFGKYIIQELVKVATSEAKQGYVRYCYKRPEKSAAEEKISFVMGIPELECYIGTGQYMADIRKSQWDYILKVSIITFILLLLLILLVRSSIQEIETKNKKLRRTESELTAIFDNSFQFIGTITIDGKLIRVNKSALNFINQDESSVLGKYFWDTPWWEDDKDINLLKQAIKDSSKGAFSRFDVTHYSLDEKKHFIDFCITPILNDCGDVISLLVEGRDVTMQKENEQEKYLLQEQLMQAQKMQAVGNLAGGIAHDFNNILGAIIGFSEMVLDELQDNEVLSKYMKNILKGGERAKKLVSQILTFSRKGPDEKSPTNLMPVVNEALDLLRATLPATVSLYTDVEHDTSPVVADANKVHEALLNLATNAIQAMNEEGELAVCLREEQTKESIQGINGSIPSGNYSIIEIQDTGAGMESELIERIFEPFYTTKEMDKGTGLGLAVVYGIMKSHDGNIQIESTPGKGTIFRLFFPKTDQKASSEKTVRSQVPGGNERILFVDDEHDLVEIGKTMLSSLGYKVTGLSDSSEARQLIHERLHDFDLLITDQTMPGLTGFDLAQEIFRLNPRFPVILCTGFSSKVDPEKAKEIGIRRFANKPLSKKSLAEEIRYAFEVMENA